MILGASDYSNFNPRSPQGGATKVLDRYLRGHYNFNPRSPQGGATKVKAVQDGKPTISIHAPRKGERLRQIARHGDCPHGFQSTLPARGSDAFGATILRPRQRISIHAPRKGERPSSAAFIASYRSISIHAPRKGERQRKSAFVCSISANLLNIIHCGTVTRTVSRRRIALFRLFSVRRSGVFMYAYASH